MIDITISLGWTTAIAALDADTALCGRKREACGSAIDAAEWDPQRLHSSAMLQCEISLGHEFGVTKIG